MIFSLKETDFIKSILDEAGADYTWDDQGDVINVSVTPGVNYVGQPIRLNGQIKGFAKFEFFSAPSELVIQRKGEGGAATPEIVFPSSESFFLQAEAAVKGLNAGADAQALYQQGIKEAMMMWGVNEGDADNYIATEDMALLNGTMDQNLEKIATQRWIASYTDGFEAWAIVRDTGYPASLAGGVADFDIYAPGTITGGGYPQRMRYGSSVAVDNPGGYASAIASQGDDVQATKLWWAK